MLSFAEKEQQLNIAYGGVLNSVEQNILPNDTDIQNIAEVCLSLKDIEIKIAWY